MAESAFSLYSPLLSDQIEDLFFGRGGSIYNCLRLSEFLYN